MMCDFNDVRLASKVRRTFWLVKKMLKLKSVFCAHVFLFLLLNSVGCAPKAEDAAEAPEAIAEKARLAIDFQAVDLQNRPFSGLSLKGKTVLLDFWAVWCKPCIAAFPTLKKLNRDFEDKNFEVVGVAVYSGGPQEVAKFIAPHDLDYTVVVGSEDLVFQFGVIGYPTYLLVGPDGKIYKKYVGEAKNLYSEVKEGILKLEGKGKS